MWLSMNGPYNGHLFIIKTDLKITSTQQPQVFKALVCGVENKLFKTLEVFGKMYVVMSSLSLRSRTCGS